MRRLDLKSRVLHSHLPTQFGHPDRIGKCRPNDRLEKQ
jgi:hypothetical protein